MNCPRCKSMMVSEKIIFAPDVWHEWVCLLCGEHIDAEILVNRQESLQRILSLKGKRAPAAAGIRD